MVPSDTGVEPVADTEPDAPSRRLDVAQSGKAA